MTRLVLTALAALAIACPAAIARAQPAQPGPRPAPAPSQAPSPAPPATPAPSSDPEPAPAPPGSPAPTAEAPDPPDDDLRIARAQYERGDVAAARDSLLRAYQLRPRPAILFALGQVELRLGRPEAAIEYYERFIATDPGPEQVSLAQQAIGAARMQRSAAANAAAAPPAPPPKRIPPRWDSNGSRLVIFGGMGLAAGAGLIVHARQLAADDRGTFSDYEARIEQARTRRWIGVGVAAAGALTITAALVRWRTSGGIEITATPTTTGAAVSLAGTW